MTKSAVGGQSRPSLIVKSWVTEREHKSDPLLHIKIQLAQT